MGRLLAVLLAVVAISIGLGVRAQDSTSTADVLATPDTALCATPLAEALGTPVVVEQAPETAATPGGVEPGEEIGLFPCGTPVGSPVGAPVVDGATVVVMVDIAYEPTEIVIPANTDVTLSLTNNGMLMHNFVIDELGINSGDYNAAQAGSVTINAPAGTYQYYCSVPGHRDIGMIGTLTVQ